MDEPLGYFSGNALEVKECADYLQGKPPELGMHEVVLELASQMIHLSSRKKISKEQAKEECESVISSQSAFPAFEKMFSAQGGDWKAFEKTFETKMATLPKFTFKSDSHGWIGECHALLCGKLIHSLGGGRVSTSDPIDPWVGIQFTKKVGDPVREGEVICEVIYSHSSHKEQVQKSLREAIKVVPKEVKKTSWILETIG
jgi:thymidine phosphorylase